MKIVTLSSKMPLTKVVSPLKKAQYPHVLRFTSEEHECATLADLFKVIKATAAAGKCLLKGEINRPLINESRAGSTTPTAPTSWVCFDLDKVNLTAEAFMMAIGASTTSYIVQYSSSHGTEYEGKPMDTRTSCHIFTLLKTPISAVVLKQWLTHLNFSIDELKASLRLTKTNCALTYGLDITTCQNDKLLYVAPPICKDGIIDTLLDKRIQLIEKQDNALPNIDTTRLTVDSIRAETEFMLTKLRTQIGISKHLSTRTKLKGDIEYMASPDEALVTEVKHERGFTYLNLNGGDSWGYYHPEEDPEFIFNFKGEPTYRTADLAPSYLVQANAHKAKAIAKRLEEDPPVGSVQMGDLLYLTFRDFESANYYNGTFDLITGKLDIARVKNEAQLKDFIKQYKLPELDYIPTWRLIYDPSSPDTVNRAQGTTNLYIPSALEKGPKPKGGQTPTIDRLIEHALGSFEDAVHFVGWLAYTLQTKKPNRTAYVLHGTQGTGKGVLFHRVLTPLFGATNATMRLMPELTKQFNGWMRSVRLVMVDEADMGQLAREGADRFNASLKNWITEPTIAVREMYAPTAVVPNHLNWILASNMPEPVSIAASDRRFSVASYQPEKIDLNKQDLCQIDRELPAFYAKLLNLDINTDSPPPPRKSAAKDAIIELSRNAVDDVLAHINNGDLLALCSSLPSRGAVLNLSQQIQADTYRSALRECLEDAKAATLTIPRDLVRSILEFTVGNMPVGPIKFKKFLAHHRVTVDARWYRGRVVQGIKVKWQDTPEMLDAITTALKES